MIPILPTTKRSKRADFHLLAVSGTHLVFAVLSLVHALTFLLVRIEPIAARWDAAGSPLIGVVLALLYVDFAGGSGSAWRAAWMLSAGLTVRALGRRPSTIRCVAASLFVGAVPDPLVAFDPLVPAFDRGDSGPDRHRPAARGPLRAVTIRPLRWFPRSASRQRWLRWCRARLCSL